MCGRPIEIRFVSWHSASAAFKGLSKLQCAEVPMRDVQARSFAYYGSFTGFLKISGKLVQYKCVRGDTSWS